MLNYVQALQAIPQPAQRSPEWYEQRKSLITSSNIPTILGENPYKKSSDYLEELLDPTLRVFTGNIATIHGQVYETPAVDAYCSAFNYTGTELGLVRLWDNHHHRDFSRIREFQLDWLAGSADHLCWPSSLENPSKEDCITIEIKCPFNNPRLKWGEIPQYYYGQVMFNMFILDTPCADFVQMIPRGFKGQKFQMNVVRVYRDDAWIWNYAMPKLDEFYANWMHRKAMKSPKGRALLTPA